MPTTKENQQAFESAIAQCVTKWAWLERMLCDLFILGVVGIQSNEVDERPACAAYFAVANFRSRLDMVNACIFYRMNDAQREEWNRLYAKISKLVKKRNAIAHSQIIAGPPTGQEGVYDYALGPNDADMHDIWANQPEKYEKQVFPTKRINQCAESFENASQAVNQLTIKIEQSLLAASP